MRATPVLGTRGRAPDSYPFMVTTTEPAPALDPAFSPVSAIFPQTSEPAPATWSRATVLGWGGLALGTIITAVLIYIAVTLP